MQLAMFLVGRTGVVEKGGASAALVCPRSQGLVRTIPQ